MKSTDRFLIGVVIGAIVLVGAAVAIALLRPPPTYQPDDTPAGVSYNYLLALRKKDFARAYGYLSPGLPGYPRSADDFVKHVEQNTWMFDQSGSRAFEIQSTQVTGENRASVTVREQRFYEGDLFDSRSSFSTFDLRLRQDGGVWKIYFGDSYWLSCWENSDGC